MRAFPILEPDRQVAFYARLEQIRSLYLREALRQAVDEIEVSDLDADLKRVVGKRALQRVASFGLRGEVFFAVPTIVRAKPTLVGYYRLLLGISQKFFYRSGNFAIFKSMEDRGIVRSSVDPLIEPLCQSLAGSAEILVDRLGDLSVSVVHELQLLTLGPQLKGGENNAVGEKAVRRFSDFIAELLKAHTVQKTTNSLTLRNPAGRLIFVKIGSDPDIAISDVTTALAIPILAIEIKGGLDNANKHNRLGEAEKSHLTAKQAGHNQFWTVVNVDYDAADVAKKSPTTQRLWRMDRLADNADQMSVDFKNLLASILGLPSA